MNYDESAYESAVNAQWLKLAKAESNEELREVLSTWPSPKDYKIEEQDDKNCDSDEQSTTNN